MRLGIDLRNSISWFAQSLIAGDLGPDDSRYSRDQMFLKYPCVVGQAMAIFLYRLETDGHRFAMGLVSRMRMAGTSPPFLTKIYCIGQ